MNAIDWTTTLSHLDEYGWAIVEGMLASDTCRAIADLRTTLYARLDPLANRWSALLGSEARYPEQHADFRERCHEAGQTRPTPRLLRYGAGDSSCLHQDLYGEHVFPFQVAFLLAEPGQDFTGGEFVLTEQRPRMQSRVEVVPLRHGVSRVRSGRRHTVGVIFHDAA